MRVLSIGNSFSQDAQKYLRKLAAHHGTPMKTVNLFIGGCSLRTHYLNMLNDSAAYNFEYNSEYIGLKTTIAEALCSEDWDVVTLQQASHLSPKYATYTPYAAALAEYVRKYCPRTKLMIHETWAYEEASDRLTNMMGFAHAEEMLVALRDAYLRTAADISADGIIPCGEAMLLAEKAGLTVHRDTSHASLGAGRYLLSLCWYKTLTGLDITNDTFSNFDVPVTDEEREIVIRAVNSAKL